MSESDTDRVPDPQDLEGLLQRAIGHHRAGNLPEAERLYRSVLAQQPGHPDANHNLGVLAVATGHAAAALPYFQAAIQANPNQGQFWLSCIDALIQASQADAAQQMLDLGVGNGLSGDAVDALRDRLQRLASASAVPSMDASETGPIPGPEPSGKVGGTERKAKGFKHGQ